MNSLFFFFFYLLALASNSAYAMITLLPTGKRIPSVGSLPPTLRQGILIKPSSLGVPDDGCTPLKEPVNLSIKRAARIMQNVPWIALVTDAAEHSKCELKRKAESMKKSGASVLLVATDADPVVQAQLAIPVVFIKTESLSAIDALLSRRQDNLSFAKVPHIPIHFTGDASGQVHPLLLLLAFTAPAIIFLMAMVIWRAIAGPEYFDDESESLLQYQFLPPASELPAPLHVVSSLPSRPHHTNDASFTDECVICLDEFEEGEGVKGMPCGHEFHAQCIDPWLLTKKRKCPVCKRDVVAMCAEKGDKGDSKGDNTLNTLAMIPSIPSSTETTINFEDDDILEARKLALASRSDI